MELIIDIPEWLYQDIQEYLHPSPLDKVIQNGIPLPKGHGRLIDADVLVDGMENDYEFCEVVNATPTIIESDKR